MKTPKILPAGLLCFFALICGCANNPTPQAANFTVVPDYGSPGAYSIDTQTALYGNETGGASCIGTGDTYCNLSFGPTYASTTATPQGYTLSTDAVGNVDWIISGRSSSNCSAGYPTTVFSVSTNMSYPLICASPTTNFVSSRPSWYSGADPASVTFTAVNTSFPASNFSTATTVYDTYSNVQWNGTVVSSSNTNITVPISNTAVGKHILVFRNPGNNSVIGSSAYVIFASKGGGPGCTKKPCTQ